jgi:hypothetical protein
MDVIKKILADPDSNYDQQKNPNRGFFCNIFVGFLWDFCGIFVGFLWDFCGIFVFKQLTFSFDSIDSVEPGALMQILREPS